MKSDIKMVPIPGGSFEMGSDGGNRDEKPVHKVTLDRFDMSSAEITNSQYAIYLNEALASGDISVTD